MKHGVGITAWIQESFSSSKHLNGRLWRLIKSSVVIVITTAGDWGGVVGMGWYGGGGG